MLKKSNTTSQRSTRSSNVTNGATVLKPIYPAIPQHQQQQHKKIQTNPLNLNNSTNINANNDSFLLPSSEFFVVDKDSLVLSESGIFQTNLARRNASCSSNLSSPDKADILLDENDLGLDDNEKENNSTAAIYSDLLHSLPSSNMKSTAGGKMKKATVMPSAAAAMPKPIAANPSIDPIKSTPVQSTPSHVPTSQGEKQALDKGLRHFSAKVCAKVEEKGVTTYNEVADDLVQEIGLEMGKCDHKNIRRRVYDALNVLMAIDIICKEKKEIRWLGLPNEAADDLRALEAERVSLQERIAEKNRNLREVLRRCISLKNLIDRNASDQQHQLGDKLPLPFILISAARDCHVHCEMLEDRTQYFFEFNTAFQINEDIELMRLMGLDTGRIEKIKSFFPKELVAQVLMLCLNNNNNSNTSNNSPGRPNGHYSNLLDTGNPTNIPSITTASSTVFAPIINDEDLNLGDLESFNPSSSTSPSPLSTTSSSL